MYTEPPGRRVARGRKQIRPVLYDEPEAGERHDGSPGGEVRRARNGRDGRDGQDRETHVVLVDPPPEEMETRAELVPFDRDHELHAADVRRRQHRAKPA